MLNLTFGEQVKIILSRRGMTIKELAEVIEQNTGKKMSRQNLTQRLGRDNFQEQDMRMIASILECPFELSILGENAAEVYSETVRRAGQAKAADVEVRTAGAVSMKAEKAAEAVEAVEAAEMAEQQVSAEAETMAVEAEQTEAEAVTAEAEEAVETAKMAEAEETAETVKAEQAEQQVSAEAGQAEETAAEKEQIEQMQAEAEAISVDAVTTEVEQIEAEAVAAEAEQAEAESISAEAMTAEAEQIETAEAEQIEAEQASGTARAKTPSLERDVTVGEFLEIQKGLDEESSDSLLKELFAEMDALEREGEERSKEREQRQETVGTGRRSWFPHLRFRRKNAAKMSADSSPDEEAPDAQAGGVSGEAEESRSSEVSGEDNTADLTAAAGTDRQEDVRAEYYLDDDDEAEDLTCGDVNPYTGREYASNSVRMHPRRIGYVQVYDRREHKWTDMTEWAFLGYQERKKVILGQDYVPPIYLD